MEVYFLNYKWNSLSKRERRIRYGFYKKFLRLDILAFSMRTLLFCQKNQLFNVFKKSVCICLVCIKGEK